MKLRTGTADDGESRGSGRRRVAAARVGLPGLALMGLLFSPAYSWIVLTKTGMITPNDHSKSVGKEVMRADVDECGAQSASELLRLRQELVGGDPEVVKRAEEEAGREAKGKAAAKVFTPDDASSAKEDAYGAVGAAAWDILFSNYDPDSVDEDMLAKYLGIEGGVSGFSASQRLKYACLRAKGYRVKSHEKDGSGAAVLLRDPARVVLREEDGSEVLFYGYVPPSRR